MVNVKCSSGTCDVNVGDEFEDSGVRWRVIGFTNTYTYSPNSLGGTPTVRCQVVSGKPKEWVREYIDAEGYCDWCADSVAVKLLEAQP